jgi:hypothetical protein
VETILAQCHVCGRRLVAVMSELRATDGQSQVTRRQLHHQHRTLTRALIDPDLQRLRREGNDILTRLEERAQWLPASEDVRSVAACVNVCLALLDAFAELGKATISFVMFSCMSVRPASWNNLAPTGRIFVKFGSWVFFDNLSRKSKFEEHLTRITCTLHEDRRTFVIISSPSLLKMRNVSDKSCRENQNTHFMFSNFFSKNPAVYEITWKNMVETDRPQMTI